MELCQYGGSKSAFIPILSSKFENKFIRMGIYFLSCKIISMAKSKTLFVCKPDFVRFKNT